MDADVTGSEGMIDVGSLSQPSYLFLETEYIGGLIEWIADPGIYIPQSTSFQ